MKRQIYFRIALILTVLFCFRTWSKSLTEVAVDNYRANLAAQSRAAAVTPASATPVTTQSTSNSTAVSESRTSTTPRISPISTGQSIAPGAQAGQKSQKSGQAMNMAAGAGMIAAGMMTKPPNFGLIAMGLMALAQGKEQGGAANQSGATYNAASYDTGDTGGVNEGGGGGSGGGTETQVPIGKDLTIGKSSLTPAVANGLSALKNAGYEVTANGLKTPDGSVVPAASLGSGSGLASAGLSPSQVSDALNVTAALNKEMSSGFSVSGVGVDSGGGGGSGEAGDPGSYADGSDSSSVGGGRNPFALGDNDKQRLMAGKTVLFDGEPIGVSGRNIFDMVHTAYQKKRATNQFIETESPASTGRVPASVSKRK